jgi:GDPmannose 4,6-dehydratase
MKLGRVRDFLDKAFAVVGLNWEEYVEIDPRYFRPTEVDLLIGDYSKAKNQLGWSPKTSFNELVRLMVMSDLAAEGVAHKARL